MSAPPFVLIDDDATSHLSSSPSLCLQGPEKTCTHMCTLHVAACPWNGMPRGNSSNTNKCLQHYPYDAARSKQTARGARLPVRRLHDALCALLSKLRATEKLAAWRCLQRRVVDIAVVGVDVTGHGHFSTNDTTPHAQTVTTIAGYSATRARAMSATQRDRISRCAGHRRGPLGFALWRGLRLRTEGGGWVGGEAAKCPARASVVARRAAGRGFYPSYPGSESQPAPSSRPTWAAPKGEGDLSVPAFMRGASLVRGVLWQSMPGREP